MCYCNFYFLKIEYKLFNIWEIGQYSYCIKVKEGKSKNKSTLSSGPTIKLKHPGYVRVQWGIQSYNHCASKLINRMSYLSFNN